MKSLKKILSYLKDFLNEDFNIVTYLYTGFFLTVCIAFNYAVNFEDDILDKYYGQPISFFYYTLYFAFAYYGVAIPTLLIARKKAILSDKRFWIISAMFIAISGFSSAFYFHRLMTDSFELTNERYFAWKILTNLRKFISMGLPLFLVFTFFKSWKIEYGLTLKNFDYKPYLLLLILMLPILFAASFSEDFLKQYPMMKPWISTDAFGLEPILHILLYELVYGSNFFFIELFFRGALVLGMYKFMGRHAILPMISAYAFLHFGKPMGETISSIFGGYIIGVIAIYTRSIFGGILIHVGIAWGMDFFALCQHYFQGKFDF